MAHKYNKPEQIITADTSLGTPRKSRNKKTSLSQTGPDSATQERLYIIHHRVNPHREDYEEELETALESRCSILIIEPESLGDEVLRWIAVGNFVHKISVLSGAAALLFSIVLPKKIQFSAPFVIASAAATAVYNISWQFDPASKFQPFSPKRHLASSSVSAADRRGSSSSAASILSQQLPLHLLQSPNPVVLVRRNDYARKLLHTSVTVVVSGMLLWNVCRKYIGGAS